MNRRPPQDTASSRFSLLLMGAEKTMLVAMRLKTREKRATRMAAGSVEEGRRDEKIVPREGNKKQGALLLYNVGAT